MRDMGFPSHLRQLFETLYREQQTAVRITEETSDWFDEPRRVRQDCSLSLHTFSILRQKI